MIIKQCETFTLNKDLNPVLTKGMIGVILEVLSDDTFEVEFVKKMGLITSMEVYIHLL